MTIVPLQHLSVYACFALFLRGTIIGGEPAHSTVDGEGEQQEKGNRQKEVPG